MYAEAREVLERAATLARAIGSRFWLNIAAGLLAGVLAETGDLASAESVLNAVLTPETPAKTVGERLLWCTSAERALARRDAQRTLRVIEQLFANTPGATVNPRIPRLLKLRGEALLLLKQSAEAARVLQEARMAAQEQGQRSCLWRIDHVRARLLRGERRYEEAELALTTAREQVNELAAGLTDVALREQFISQASTLLAPARPLSSRRAEKLAYEGLTTREREIAALVAQGRYNREIAEELVLSERTVETHVRNIMLKPGFTSRRQIVLWAVKKGLAPEA